MNWMAEVDQVGSREELAAFVQLLADECAARSDEWENRSLDRFLAALAAWIHDMEGYYLNQGVQPPDTPSWKTFAEMLTAARIYE